MIPDGSARQKSRQTCSVTFKEKDGFSKQTWFPHLPTKGFLSEETKQKAGYSTCLWGATMYGEFTWVHHFSHIISVVMSIAFDLVNSQEPGEGCWPPCGVY